jgi:SAM-dependent methyltransferase
MTPLKLNVGCGRNILEGWVNLDSYAQAGVDIVADLEQCATSPIALANDSVDEFLLSHVLEHIRQPLPLMQELWRIAKPGAKMTIRVPYGSSDDASEDPTHVRHHYLSSFGYFSQPFYWRADYGYRGDWRPDTLTLAIHRHGHEGMTPGEIMERVMRLRNVVAEMTAELTCVKPARQPLRELQQAPQVELELVG